MHDGLPQGYELGELDISHFVGGPIEQAVLPSDGVWLSVIAIAAALLLLIRLFPRRERGRSSGFEQLDL